MNNSETIQIGLAVDGKTPVCLNLESFLKTRLLVTANSGGGKSYLMRLLAERICGHMPVIIIDPEGEFFSLREKFPFLLIGPGGEAPADCRSAKFTIQKILELRSSAIFDLSELSIPDRHRYVRLLSEGAINSPKNLWQPTVFMFDEAHDVCPENGKGQSEARTAVLGFPTKGRKRRFGCVFGTQRLHKLAMDARAEMLNRIVGMTFEPDDIDAAAKILSPDDKKVFAKQMRELPEGRFHMFGRAISLETKLVQVDTVKTPHGIDDGVKAGFVPPTPKKIKHLLPQLADLPAQAEEEAQTVSELKAQLILARSDLAEARRQQPATKTETKVKIQKERIFTPGESKRLTELLALAKKIEPQTNRLIEQMEQHSAGIVSDSQTVSDSLDELLRGVEHLTKRMTPETNVPAVATAIAKPVITHARDIKTGSVVKLADALPHIPASLDGIKGGVLDTLRVCAQYRSTGASDSQIGVLIGKKSTSRKTFRSTLMSKGLIEAFGAGWRATDAGIAALGSSFQPLPTGKELQEYWRQRLAGGELACFNEFVAHYPNEVSDEHLQQVTQRKSTSIKTFKSSLRARKLLEGNRASANLFD